MANNEITSYSFHDRAIRTITEENNEIIFCLADVCKVLDLKNPTHAVAQIKEEFGTPTLNVGMVTRPDGSSVQATFITEPQLYFVMMRSRAKVAREFRQWIVNEVLPSIRKSGSYTKANPEAISVEDLKKLASTSWNANKIFNVLKCKVDTPTILECVNVAATSWRQGYAVACKQKEKEIEELRGHIKELEANLTEARSGLIETQNINPDMPNQELLSLAQGYAALGAKALQLLKEERLGQQSITLK